MQFSYGDDGVDPSKSRYERHIEEIVEEELANVLGEGGRGE